MADQYTIEVHTFVSKDIKRLTSERTKLIVVAENRRASSFLRTSGSTETFLFVDTYFLAVSVMPGIPPVAVLMIPALMPVLPIPSFSSRT